MRTALGCYMIGCICSFLFKSRHSFQALIVPLLEESISRLIDFPSAIWLLYNVGPLQPECLSQSAGYTQIPHPASRSLTNFLTTLSCLPLVSFTCFHYQPICHLFILTCPELSWFYGFTSFFASEMLFALVFTCQKILFGLKMWMTVDLEIPHVGMLWK